MIERLTRDFKSESFSVVSGSAAQIRRIRFRCFSLINGIESTVPARLNSGFIACGQSSHGHFGASRVAVKPTPMDTQSRTDPLPGAYLP